MARLVTERTFPPSFLMDCTVGPIVAPHLPIELCDHNDFTCIDGFLYGFFVVSEPPATETPVLHSICAFLTKRTLWMSIHNFRNGVIPTWVDHLNVYGGW